MKNKKHIMLVLMIVVVIISIYLITVPSDETDNELAKGTITKIDKYKKQQMSDENVLLRSELLKDTSEVRKVIVGLYNFNAFVTDLGFRVDSVWIPQMIKFYKEIGWHCSCIDELQDFGKFLKNNNNTILKTIELLELLYKGKLNQSEDVETKLISFTNFVGQFSAKDSVIDETIGEIDDYVKNDKSRKKAITQLKELRDRIVVDNLIVSIGLGKANKAERIASIALYNYNTLSALNPNIAIESNYVQSDRKSVV